jgi:hypothetical protein
MSHLILVLGMHRSGTSIVARSLQCFGVELGQQAEWFMPDNPKGFWEHRGVLAINETLLGNIGHDWDDSNSWVPALNAYFGQETHTPPLGNFGFRVVALELQDMPLFGLKEPRMCRLLPFWRPIFELIGCQVSVVHVVRHPLAVARSLQQRNGLSIERGLALWLEYTQRQFLDARPEWKSVVVEYDSMVASPLPHLAKIGATLGLQLDDMKAQVFTQSYIDLTLKHQIEKDISSLPEETAAIWSKVLDKARIS